MKAVCRTYKFRMYPNAEQRQVLVCHFGSVRFIYNHYLKERKRQYEETGKSDNYAKQAKVLFRSNVKRASTGSRRLIAKLYADPDASRYRIQELLQSHV